MWLYHDILNISGHILEDREGERDGREWGGEREGERERYGMMV